MALGVERIFFTGGEPLARPDIFELCSRVVSTHGRELVILTNGTLLKGDRLTNLVKLAPAAPPLARTDAPVPGVRLQVSLDGSTAEVNDPIRGKGSFTAIVDGVAAAVAIGLRPTLTTTILRHNLDDLGDVIRLASQLRVQNVHLLWPHRRGRVLSGAFAELPSADEILGAVRKARQVARGVGVSIENVDEFRLRLDGTPGVKSDLAGAGWDSLCVYTDGWVYPSASMAGVRELRCGDLGSTRLEEIWKDSALCGESVPRASRRSRYAGRAP